MSMLHRKLVRDLFTMRSQVIAIAAVISCGIGTFIMSASTVRSLESTRAEYYREYRFANLFCDLRRAPDSIASRIAELDGVQDWETRVTAYVRLNLEGVRDSPQAQILSLPSDGLGRLNRIHLRSGRFPDVDSDREVVVSEAFSKAHGLSPGVEIEAVIYGTLVKLQIVGIGLSPEFIYEIGPGGLLPDSKAFGILWMNRNALAASVGMTGAFNQLSMLVSDRMETKEVLRKVDSILEPYGGLGAISRKDQRSHRFISSEMDELRSMGIAAPTIFLCVAAFLMNMVLSRLIATQREQIAALKAFGFTRHEIAIHYLGMAWLIAGTGTIAGTGLGLYLGNGLTKMYANFFHFPTFSFSIPWYIFLLALFISGLAATLGVWMSIRSVMQLQPAEAMRPEPPQVYHKVFIEKIVELFASGTAPRMVVRHLVRHPRRATLSVLGIALSVAVLILGSFMQDAVFSMFDSLFRLSKRYDVQVSFREPLHESVEHELRSLVGVLDVELSRAIPIRVQSAQRERLVALQGVDEDAELSLLVDGAGKEVSLPQGGLLLSRKLADVLHTSVGDTLYIEVLEEDRKTIQLPIAGLIDDLAGENVYIERGSLSKLLSEVPRVNAAYLLVDSWQMEETMDALRDRPGIASMAVTQNLKESFLKTIAENVRRMRNLNMIFSMIIAVGVIYSTARISLAERSRDLATLRVLGFSHREIRNILVGELTLLTFVAIPLGWMLGYGLAYWTVHMFDRELFRMPLVVRFHTYAYAAMIVGLAMLLAIWVMDRHLRQLSIVEVLKSRE